MAVAPEQAAPMMGGPAAPSNELIRTFLQNGIAMMRSEKVREALKDRAQGDPGQKLIELQRAEWDALKVDRDIGCAFLEKLHEVCPDDMSLFALRDDFVKTAQRTFLLALEDRRPKKLETKLKMPRELVIEFFNACNTKMDLPETHERLQKHMEKTEQVPNQLIIGLQRDLLEVLGWEADHACALLSRLDKDFPDDTELFRRMEGWKQKASQTCMAVVRAHQAKGGALPKGPFGENPAMAHLKGKAEKALAKMTQAEKQELLQRMQKKVEIFMNLPQEGRESYMKKLSEDDKLEFVKTQVLLVGMMKAQWEAGQGQQQGVRQATMDGSGSGGTYAAPQAAAVPAPTPASMDACVAPPSQQQMMM